MKLVIIILIVTFMQASATSFAQKITINVKHSSLQSVFKAIGKQSGYDFFYDVKTLKDAKPIDLKIENAPIEDVLKLCFEGQPFYYTIENKVVVIKEKEKPLQNSSMLITVKGRVVDEKGVSLPGASVTVKGTKNMAATNAAGEFELKGVNGDATLVISFIGYVAQEVPVNNQAAITITLKEANTALNEVIVTALGIKREERSLGYAVQKVDGSDLTNAPTGNWINALSGKVPGLQLNKVGGPVGSSDVVLRGDNVLALGGSTALIIIDGVPVSTQQSGTGYGALVAADNPIDFGSSLSDLDPESIESVSVLKGPGAAALYGSRASNGAIIITTKSGKKTPGLGVSFSSNTSFSSVNRYPDYQFEYGAGGVGSTYYSYGNSVDGKGTNNSTASFGPAYSGQSYFQYNSPFDASVDPNPLTSPRTARVPWVPHKDYVSGFFKTGVDVTNTIALTGSGYRGSVTYTKNNWIIPNTGYDRLNVALSGEQNISPKITLSSKLNYTRKSSDNLPGQGYNNQAIMYFMAQSSSSFDINWYKKRFLDGQEGIAENTPVGGGYMDNPYVMAYDMLNASDRNNVIGNINANVKFNDKLSLMLRSGMDLSYEFRSQQRPIGTYKFKEGMYRQQSVYRLESNSDFLLKYADKLPASITYTVSLGGNQRFNDYKWMDEYATKLSLPNVYNLSNSKDPIQATSDRSSFMVNSLYAFANFAYKSKVYLEITGRNDWSSTLPSNNSSFFYPSVNTSVVLNEIFKLPDFVSFAKWRGSYAATGVDAKTPYGFLVNYSRTAFPGSLQLPTTLPNKNLNPQFTNAFETGLDLRFFKSRIGLDLALYKNVTKDQILSLPISGATGYSTALTNVGKVENKGIEVQLRGTPLQSKKGLNWDVILNWSANRNKVLDVSSVLGQEGQLVLYNVGFANINMVAEEGKPLGQLYGLGFKRSPDGQIIYTSAGIPVLGTTLQNWGSINPDWTGSIRNSFAYRNVSFSFLLDIRKGGKMMSYTNAILSATGKLKNSLPGRADGGIVGPGVQQLADGSYIPNTTKAIPGTYYAQYYIYSNMETNVFSTSFVKLRETTLAYTFPKSMFRKSVFQELRVGISGRDLFTWSKFPAFDPETATLNSSQILPGIEIGQFPSTRTITMNVNVKF